ncbi:uncharacterized protein PV07_09984 [Cladophialophora immunda]|uniref:Uncharacterized protein n=1 Tax=Cladophialophora immunda TaxID=569365 RepID=A0A0D1Z9B0_9EURO|nr:uncharacterized protein PV07_09984 [Cladophialophora immunda]KIW24256.1 hypothetical protein PV07_09984 [Cladophialophora immunda]
MAHRSGRPSMLNDEEINCEWPKPQELTTKINSVYSTPLIMLAQLISQVTRKFSTVQAFQQSPQAVAAIVVDLDRKTTAFEEYIRPHIAFEHPTEPPRASSGLSNQQAIYIRLLYFILVVGIYSTLTNPSCRTALNFKDSPDVQLQVEKSTEIVVKASRTAILTAHYIHVDANTPILLSFFGPLCAEINLSIHHIFEAPERSTTQSDLALLDIGSAHFSRVEFSTGLSFPFAKDMAALARNFVQRVKSAPTSNAGGKNVAGEFMTGLLGTALSGGNSHRQDNFGAIFSPVRILGDYSQIPQQIHL